MSPLGPGQRRLSRSPRSQRSRSADVDCLKKFAERKLYEERKLPDVCDYNKFDSTSRLMPLSSDDNDVIINRPKSSTRVYVEFHQKNDFEPEQSKIQDSNRWLPVINRKVCPENIDDHKYAKQPASRSLSSESGYTRQDNYFRERKNSQFELYGRETFEKTR